MAVGTADPLEGSLLILPGCGMVTLGQFVASRDRRTLLYWIWTFIMISIGVGAMIVLSELGGIGGKSGRSLWWGLLLLPYPAGWLMALAGGIVELVRLFKAKRHAAQA
jgi:hypothetical protein